MPLPLREETEVTSCVVAPGMFWWGVVPPYPMHVVPWWQSPATPCVCPYCAGGRSYTHHHITITSTDTVV